MYLCYKKLPYAKNNKNIKIVVCKYNSYLSHVKSCSTTTRDNYFLRKCRGNLIKGKIEP